MPLVFGLLLFGAGTPGCGRLDDLSAPPTPSYWAPLWIARSDFVEMALDGDRLYAADRTEGVYVQEPAFEGRWKPLGLAFRDLDDPFHRHGITSLTASDGLVVVGVSLPFGDSRSRLYRRRAGENSWTPVEGITSTVMALSSPEPGLLLGLDQEGLFLSRDGGVTFSRDDNAELALKRGSLAANRNPLYCGGQSWEGEPQLFRSRDRGETWSRIPLTRALGVSIGAVSSVVTGASPADIFTTVNGTIYRSLDGGATFSRFFEITRFPGTLSVNPDDPDEIVIASQELYWSRDGGRSWEVFGFPPGFAIGFATTDWGRRRVAVQVGDLKNEAIYAFDLDIAGLFLDN
jgi:hypothetical protein